MTQQKKIPSDLEEKIQSIAGDIYIQIEDKVSALMVSCSTPTEISSDIVEEHITYQTLKKELDHSNDELQKSKKLMLKDATKIKALLASIEASKKEEKKLNEKVAKLEIVEGDLAKTEKNKANALDVQTKKISELTLQLKNTTSELDFLKVELNQQSESTQQKLSAEQSTVKQYQSDIISLKQHINGLEQELIQEKTKAEQLSVELKKLSKTIENSKGNLITEKANTEQVSLQAAQLKSDVARLTNNILENEKLVKDSRTLLESERKAKSDMQNKHLLEISSLKQSIDKHRIEIESLINNHDQSQTQINTLTSSLKASEESNKEQKVLLTDMKNNHEVALASLQDALTQEQNVVKELENKNVDYITVIETKDNAHKSTVDTYEKSINEQKNEVTQLTQKVKLSEQTLVKLKHENNELTSSHEKTKKSVESYQQEISNLKEKQDSAVQKYSSMQSRVEANKTKQEIEFNKARDTIKYLRDENLELNTKLDQQVSELEDKIREYRLRFEYAQKQLNTK